ncbi:hypothetical protein J2Z60_002130 [Lactobacillus colini]|uniref:Bacteriocin helveticin-J n=1 Tax=Lactobacillus colini TaxID=1819254 RepID=A0ABS4MHW2_9LACO|nr:helveticin J family class III bacteriocin [Lactobacillus colini]MBP2058939.1 hypothetical protein [Lactobacillus colini]
MKDLKNEATNVSKVLKSELVAPYVNVVQKGNVGSKYNYALQLHKGVTYVYRGIGSKMNTSVLTLSGSAAGHTQTWEYSGRSNKWFVGVKPSNINGSSINWAKQIARVDIKLNGGMHSSNTDFPRLAYLNRAGSTSFSGDSMTHAEAAVSPDYTKFLIATVESGRIGHFTIYDLDTINNALDNAGIGYVSLENFPYIDSFTISNLYGGSNDDVVLNSIQGFDIDNSGNIYISSQLSPKYDSKSKKWSVHHKQIVKIPFYARNEAAEDSQWQTVNLSKLKIVDLTGKHSEVESIQIIGENHCYLTVAYHQLVSNVNKTVLNNIYELTWD